MARSLKAVQVAELLRINARDGGVRASVVVQEAEPKTSPLHDAFPWDDKLAAHEHRLDIARRMIRVAIIPPTLPGQEPDKFVHVPVIAQQEDVEGVYHPMSVVVESVDMFSRALAELASKVRAATAAADTLRQAAAAQHNPDAERMARIAMAITALQTAGAAVQALH